MALWLGLGEWILLVMAPRPVVPTELTEGPFTLSEARRFGISRRQLSGLSWTAMGGGYYRWARLEESPWVILAAVYKRLPVGAAFSGLTAAWLHGLDVAPCDPVEVTIPKELGVAARAGVRVRRTVLPLWDLAWRQGLPVTSALRTATDLGRRLPLVEAVVAVDMALHAGLVGLQELESFVEAERGRKGMARLRRVVGFAEPLAESAMESRLRMILVLGGLPRPEAQVSLYDASGRFLGRADLLYRKQRLVLEYDGGIHRERLVQDNQRQNLLLGAGYGIRRFTAVDLRTPQEVVLQVRVALGGRRAHVSTSGPFAAA